MNSYECNIDFTAPPIKVYETLTTPEGLRGWWTKDCDVSTNVGQVSTFRFGETFNQMRIEELVPGEKVHWYCIGQYHHAEELTVKDEWKGTEVLFSLLENEQGTHLTFTHQGLTPELECYELCHRGWNHFLQVSLREYVESGQGQPFTEV